MESIAKSKALNERVKRLKHQTRLIRRENKEGAFDVNIVPTYNYVTVKNRTNYNAHLDPTTQEAQSLMMGISIVCRDPSPGSRNQYVHDKTFADALAKVVQDRMPSLMDEVTKVLAEEAEAELEKAERQVAQAQIDLREMRHVRV